MNAALAFLARNSPQTAPYGYENLFSGAAISAIPALGDRGIEWSRNLLMVVAST